MTRDTMSVIGMRYVEGQLDAVEAAIEDARRSMRLNPVYPKSQIDTAHGILSRLVELTSGEEVGRG